MTLHHTKHHQTYVNGLNAAEEAYAKAESPKEKIALHAALKFNGGGTYILDFVNNNCIVYHWLGHINHSLFWKNLAPVNGEGGKLENGPLKSAIERDFGSVEAFKKTFNAKTAAIQGSGWGWLVSIHSRRSRTLLMTDISFRVLTLRLRNWRLWQLPIKTL